MDAAWLDKYELFEGAPVGAVIADWGSSRCHRTKLSPFSAGRSAICAGTVHSIRSPTARAAPSQTPSSIALASRQPALAKLPLSQRASGFSVPHHPAQTHNRLRHNGNVEHDRNTLSFGLVGWLLGRRRSSSPFFPSYVLLMFLGMTVSDSATLAMTIW